MTDEQTIPKAWKKLGAYLHQDYRLEFPDCWSAIDAFVSALTQTDRNELVRFLEPLVNEDQPGGWLKKVWLSSGAEAFPRREKPRQVFEKLIQRLKAKT